MVYTKVMNEKPRKRKLSELRLDGGVLCLDFVNTVHSRTVTPVWDYLFVYGELVKWLRKCEAINAQQARQLLHLANENPVGAQRRLQEAITVRELLYEIFSALASGQSPSASRMATLNDKIRDAWGRLEISLGRSAGLWSWRKNSLDLDFPKRLVLRSAAELLTSKYDGRIRECPTCKWVFFDKSKNASRKWCSMEDCGSVDKASRYYYRKKAQAARQR